MLLSFVRQGTQSVGDVFRTIKNKRREAAVERKLNGHTRRESLRFRYNAYLERRRVRKQRRALNSAFTKFANCVAEARSLIR